MATYFFSSFTQAQAQVFDAQTDSMIFNTPEVGSDFRVSINVLLAVFNLLPVPPLDGFGFVFGLSPRPIKIALLPLQRYGPIILLAMLFLAQPVLNAYLRGGSTIVNNFLSVLANGA